MANSYESLEQAAALSCPYPTARRSLLTRLDERLEAK